MRGRAGAGAVTGPACQAGSVPVALGVPALAPSAIPGSGGADPHRPHPASLVQLFLFHTITLRPPHNFTQCTTRGSFPRAWHETLYNMVGFACLFLLPLLIMVCCYARILLEISRRMGSGLCECQAPRDTAPRPGEVLSGALQGPPSFPPGRGVLSQPHFPSRAVPLQSPRRTRRCGAPGTTSPGPGCGCCG